MTVTQTPAVSQPEAAIAGSAVSHPTPCPPWCKDRGHRIDHRFGPTCTFHWGSRYSVSNPRPLEDAEVTLLTAELVVGDEDGRLGEASLFIEGASDIDLSPAEADVFIAQMQAFVDTLRVLRGQMGAGRLEGQGPVFPV